MSRDVRQKIIQQIQMNTNFRDIGETSDFNLSKLKNIPEARLDSKYKSEKIDVNDVIGNINKLTDYVYQKYRSRNLSLKKIIKKAEKIIPHFNLNKKYLYLFQILYEQKLQNPNSRLPYSDENIIADKLGKITPVSIERSKMDKLSGEDKKYIKELAELSVRSENLHNNIVNRHLTYSDCDPIVLISPYDPLHHNIDNHVHPLIAALFIPKIQAIEERMMLSNIPKTISHRVVRKPIKYRPDLELYMDLTTDPNELACADDSIFKDLANRSKVQIALKKDVLSLRNGRLFNCDSDLFLEMMNNCVTSSDDISHALFDEGPQVLIRKLFSIFSLRPTLVRSMPTVHTMGNVQPPVFYERPKKLSVINVTLPLPGVAYQEVNLMSGLQQYQYFFDKNLVVPKKHEVIYSHGVIVFTVNRKYHNVVNNLDRYRTGIASIASLPITIRSNRRANVSPVDVGLTLDIMERTYHLRSAVLVETDENHDDRIIGHSAVFVKNSLYKGRDTLGSGDMSFFQYNPLNCVFPDYDNVDPSDPYNAIRRFHQPITRLTKDSESLDADVKGAFSANGGLVKQNMVNSYPQDGNFMDMVKTKAVVLIYSAEPRDYAENCS